MKLIFASHNPGKIVEMKSILSDLDIDILSAEEAGVFEDVEEDQYTFFDNAYKKAKFVVDKTRQWAVADDSGLCIEAIDGAPGVHSARWAGQGKTGEEIIDLTLRKLESVPNEKRGAYFKTVVVLVSPSGESWSFEGKIEGRIIKEKRGEFHPKLPYDAIFIPKGHKETFAEIGNERKNKMSNRGQAFSKMKEFLQNR